MGVLEPVKAKVLAVQAIPNVDPDLAQRLNLRPDQKSLGMLTCDIDDSCYVAIDEATKQADVEVVYAKSFYAGSNYPSGALSGEIIAMLAGPNPAEVRAGLNAAIKYIEEEAWFYSANENNTILFFPHLISRTGSYLSKMGNIPLGEPLAYLIACPIEATYALDAALKAAEVRMVEWFAPPSETNYSGGLLHGTQSACKAACAAFQEAVLEVARYPIKY